MTVSPLCDNETIEAAIREGERLRYAGRDPWAEARDEEERATARARACRIAASHRLVKGPKCPTRSPGLDADAAGFLLDFGLKKRGKPTPELVDASPTWAPDTQRPGVFAVLEKRDWAGEWRIRTETRPPMGTPTQEQAGDRITELLSDRGARTIADSCYWVATKRGGYSTFVTLTLSDEAREKLARRKLVPVGAITEQGWQDVPPMPIRASQGELAPDYSPKNPANAFQVHIESLNAEVSGPFAAIHPETMRPFSPVKEGWSWSLQREASRFFEAASKMYQRGWQYKRLGNRKRERAGLACDVETRQEYQPLELVTIKVKGSKNCVAKKRQDRTPQAVIKTEFGKRLTVLEDGPYTPIRFAEVTWLQDGPYTPIEFKPEPLDYLWVAENPDRVDEETGEWLGENPHIHVLMRWRVQYRHFAAWASRIEKLWGQGMAHLEKIKHPEKAGAYVAKAAGYMTKGQYGDENYQGKIRGNRYAISRRARAPKWAECERWRVGVMGWLLAEASELWEKKHGPKIAEREGLKKDLKETDIRKKRYQIGQRLQEVREHLKALPRISKYSAIFKSDEQKDRFIEWAKARDWTPEVPETVWLAEWRRRQLERRFGPRAGPEAWLEWFHLADSMPINEVAA